MLPRRSPPRKLCEWRSGEHQHPRVTGACECWDSGREKELHCTAWGADKGTVTHFMALCSNRSVKEREKKIYIAINEKKTNIFYASSVSWLCLYITILQQKSSFDVTVHVTQKENALSIVQSPLLSNFDAKLKEKNLKRRKLPSPVGFLKIK